MSPCSESPSSPKARLPHGALSAGMVTQPSKELWIQPTRGKNLRLCVLCLLLHDLQDHFAGSRAALRGGVDADGFFCSSCVLLTVNINPASTALMSEWAQSRGSAALQHVLAALLLQHPCRLPTAEAWMYTGKERAVNSGLSIPCRYCS